MHVFSGKDYDLACFCSDLFLAISLHQCENLLKWGNEMVSRIIIASARDMAGVCAKTDGSAVDIYILSMIVMNNSIVEGNDERLGLVSTALSLTEPGR